jgi:hypothetical protein
MHERLATAMAGLVVLLGCTAQTSVPVSPPSIPANSPTVIATAVVPARHQPRDQGLSGISGLAYDRDRDEWIAVSDDRQAPRWFTARFLVHGHQLRLITGRPVMATVPPLVRGDRRVPDFEAVAILPGGDLLVASEGARDAGQRYPASIMRFRRDGSYVSDVRIPERFLPSTSGGLDRGLRDNHGFESLGISADGLRLWAIAEAPLLQDDEPATARRGARTRLIEFAFEGDSFSAIRELVYAIDRVPIPRSLGQSADVVDQGVSEMTVLADGSLLSMERAFVRDGAGGRSENVIRVFRLHLDGADDVSRIDSLRQAPYARPIRKELLGDLATVASAFPPELSTLENFEAMAPGPRVAEGSSLVVMSDDNFSATQVTAAVLLRFARIE